MVKQLIAQSDWPLGGCVPFEWWPSIIQGYKTDPSKAVS